jgi:hypothetical protein
VAAMTPDRPTFRGLLWTQLRGGNINPLYMDPLSPSPRRSTARLLFWVVYLLTFFGVYYWLFKPTWQVIVVGIAAGAAVDLLRALREARRIMRVLDVARRVRGAAS